MKPAAAVQVDLRTLLSRYPRVPIAHLPTPLERLPNISAELGIDLLVKREDLTGLALGGNKTRKLEYVIADAQKAGADTVLTWGGVQSNWCRQFAAAAQSAGLRPVLLLYTRPGLPSQVDGNLFLDYLSGAEIIVREFPAVASMDHLSGPIAEQVGELLEKEQAAGRRCYVAPIGASEPAGSMSRPLGAIAYAQAFLELLDQAEALGIGVDRIILATGSGSMHAGLVAAANILRSSLQVIALSVCGERSELLRRTAEIVAQTLAEFQCDMRIAPEEFVIFDEFFGEGYGQLNHETASAIRLMAQKEGIYLDPVYTGKAMSGLLQLLKNGYIREGETIVFIHSGGTPALFPYKKELGAMLGF